MTWFHHLEDDVGGNFEKRVRDEEECNGGVVLEATQIKVLIHTGDFGVADYDVLVSICKSVERGEF